MGGLCSLCASDLADVIRTKQASAREVVTAHLEQIERVNPAVNAITEVLADQALAAARQLDEQLAVRGEVCGPLHGVPLTVKANIDLAGSATTEGVVALAGYLPVCDAPHIALAKAAGAIPIARTNLPDFGLRWHTDNALNGATLNPWDRSRTPGGSSGGDAVAVATGMTPLGMGNDLGGSLRVPSQFNGTAALKPSTGRIAVRHTTSPVEMPMTFQLWLVEGLIARRVRDLRRTFDAVCGPDARDPFWIPAPLRGATRGSPVRVAIVRDPGGLGLDSAVAAGLQRAADALADAGYDVVDAEPPVMDAYRSWRSLIISDLRRMWPLMQPLMSEGARRFTEQSLALEPAGDPAAYATGLAARAGIARAWSEFQESRPLVVGPISTQQPFPVGRDISSVDELDAIVESMRMAVAINNMGLPSVAVPVGVDDGRPQGVQVIGPRYREDLCLDAADAIEARLGVVTPVVPKWL